MAKVDKLFELIQFLSMSEKRYFKVFAARHHKKKQNISYLTLFNAIEKLNVYDEKALQSQGVNITYLAADKNYLYNLLLQSLRSFHLGKSASLTVKEYLEYIEILYYKGLHGQCLKLLQKAKKIAQSHELNILLISILSWEVQLTKHILDTAYVDNIYQEVDHCIKKILNYNHYNKLYRRGFLLGMTNEPKVRNSNSAGEVEKLMVHPLLQNIKYAESLAAKIRFYELHSLYNYMLNNKDKELYYNEQIIQLMDNNMSYTRENPNNYVMAHCRKIVTENQLGISNTKERLAQFRAIPATLTKAKAEVEIMVFILSYGIEMDLLIQERAFEDAFVLIKKVEQGLKKYKHRIRKDFVISAHHRIAYIYIGLQKFSKALTHINKILNDFDGAFRPDLYHISKIMNLIIHYELNNIALVRHIIKSTQEYLKKRNRLYEVENLVIKGLQKLIRCKTNKEKEATLLILRKELISKRKDGFEGQSFENFDFILWIDNKIKNEPILAINSTKNK